MSDRRTTLQWTYRLAGFLGGMAIVCLPLALIPRAPPHTLMQPSAIVIMTMTTTAGIAWALAFAWLSWRKLDEFAREGAKFAWYWGGTVGLCVTAPAYVFIALGGLHWLWPAIPAGVHLFRAFVLGYGLAVVSQLAGFFVALGLWRWARR